MKRISSLCFIRCELLLCESCLCASAFLSPHSQIDVQVCLCPAPPVCVCDAGVATAQQCVHWQRPEQDKVAVCGSPLLFTPSSGICLSPPTVLALQDTQAQPFMSVLGF